MLGGVPYSASKAIRGLCRQSWPTVVLCLSGKESALVSLLYSVSGWNSLREWQPESNHWISKLGLLVSYSLCSRKQAKYILMAPIPCTVLLQLRQVDKKMKDKRQDDQKIKCLKPSPSLLRIIPTNPLRLIPVLLYQMLPLATELGLEVIFL